MTGGAVSVGVETQKSKKMHECLVPNSGNNGYSGLAWDADDGKEPFLGERETILLDQEYRQPANPQNPKSWVSLVGLDRLQKTYPTLGNSISRWARLVGDSETMIAEVSRFPVPADEYILVYPGYYSVWTHMPSASDPEQTEESSCISGESASGEVRNGVKMTRPLAQRPPLDVGNAWEKELIRCPMRI